MVGNAMRVMIYPNERGREVDVKLEITEFMLEWKKDEFLDWLSMLERVSGYKDLSNVKVEHHFWRFQVTVNHS